MKSIYRCSTYGFLEIENTCPVDKTGIELSASCVSGVYGAAFIPGESRLHVIFNPEKTNLYEINCAIALAGYYGHLYGINRENPE